MKICYNCFNEIPDGAGTCPHCGSSADLWNGDKYPYALPCGSVLNGKYIVGRVLGLGSIGITYIGQQYDTKQLVAIKEYYPGAIATRNALHFVIPFRKDKSGDYEYGKKQFLDEAKTLSAFIGSPNIVRVFGYFEENRTAYFVMEYVKGQNLRQYIADCGGRISWEETSDFIERLIEDKLESPRSLGSDIPSGAEAALLKALAVRSVDRFKTTGEFKSALLQDSLSKLTEESIKPATSQGRCNKRIKPIGNNKRILNPREKPKCISGNYEAEYGESGPIERMRYVTEFGRPEFICLWCRCGVVFLYCPECGHSLNEKMDCPQCGFDYKKHPPICRNCYEPTRLMCPQCFESVFFGERYCSNCGNKM